MLLSSGAIVAQNVDTSHPERNANAATRTVENQAIAQSQRLVELLDLNQDQATELITLFTSVAEQRAQARNRNLKGDDMAKALMKINSSRERGIIKILTPEQREAYKATQVRTP